MSTLSAHLESYAELRRALGYKPEADTRLLSGFVRYLDTAGQPTVTVDAALAWAAQAPTAPAGAARLTVLRGFARYLSGFDPPARSHRWASSGPTRCVPHRTSTRLESSPPSSRRPPPWCRGCGRPPWAP